MLPQNNLIQNIGMSDREKYMSRKFQLIKDYYAQGINLYKKKTIEIKPGVTVLVGCNGAGKTTLLHQLQALLKKDNIPCVLYDNLHSGGNASISEAMRNGDVGFCATAMCSSEGENIYMNIGRLAERLGKFIKNGEDPKEKILNQLARSLALINGKDSEPEPKLSNERWVLLDAIDSGFSIDNIVDVKELLFQTMLEHNFDTEIYILVVANEYEMARGENCFDVQNGKYTTFSNYEEYRNFVFKSRTQKDLRIEQENKRPIRDMARPRNQSEEHR